MRSVNDVNEIDKNLEPLWKFTHWSVNAEDRIKVVNKDPDNLLISWRKQVEVNNIIF